MQPLMVQVFGQCNTLGFANLAALCEAANVKPKLLFVEDDNCSGLKRRTTAAVVWLGPGPESKDVDTARKRGMEVLDGPAFKKKLRDEFGIKLCKPQQPAVAPKAAAVPTGAGKQRAKAAGGAPAPKGANRSNRVSWAVTQDMSQQTIKYNYFVAHNQCVCGSNLVVLTRTERSIGRQGAEQGYPYLTCAAAASAAYHASLGGAGGQQTAAECKMPRRPVVLHFYDSDE